MCSATEQCQTELRADAVRQETRYSHSLSQHTLFLSCLLSSLSWQVAQLLQVQCRHAVAAGAV